jgi:hypothetical protein
MLSSDWLIKGDFFFNNSYFFPLYPHRRGICPWEFRIGLGEYHAGGKIPSLNSL